MGKKIQIIILLLLFTVSLQSKVTVWKLQPVKPTLAVSSVNRAELIEYAKSFIGKPYKYASADPAKGFDCSGFVHYVFKNYNIILPRGSKEYKSIGSALKPEDFKVGDVLVFYGYRNNTQIGHVGIICEADGMNSRFIHSSSGKAYGVTISDLNSEMYTRRFYKCVDVIN